MEEGLPGLTHQEATEKLAQFGYNEINDIHRVSWERIFLRQVKGNLVFWLLVTATAIAFVVGEMVTGCVLVFNLFLMVFVGFVQEYKAEETMKNLKEMIMPFSVVVRDGRQQEVKTRELVPGDILILRTGEKVPADAQILTESNLLVNESLLTGESGEVGKRFVAGDKVAGDENMLFAGTFLVGGRSTARVVHTGMNTRFGGITNMISTAEKELPLTRKVNQIAKYMVLVAIVVSISTGILMTMRIGAISYQTISPVLILVIALCVSAFPEGFPVVLITTLAAGMRRMAKSNAIVNRMSIIETLGETTVVCVDKTGTLTKGEMTARRIYADGKHWDISGVGYEVSGDFSIGGEKVNFDGQTTLGLIAKTAVLCSDTRIERTGEDNIYRILGRPTEGSLMVMAAKASIFREDISSAREAEIPFSSERKMMSVLCREGDKYNIYTKGAVEVLLKKCRYVMVNGEKKRLGDEEKKTVLSANSQMAASPYRTIGLAYREADGSGTNYQEEDLAFLGIVGIEDPPRDGVKEAVAMARKAGIAIKMITGDNMDTALGVAREIGLSGNILLGEDLDRLTEQELSKVIGGITVFARVLPEHKLKVIRALKSLGEVVTMTGDGVNDAPALKEAHVGVAMGIGGTDVSRSVADLTLRDNNFVTIIQAIREGRTIFNNIRKFVTYQLSCNVAELLILFFGVLLSPIFGWQAPMLLALQILFMNLVTDDLPAITLGLNRTSGDVMETGPRKGAEILNRHLWVLLVLTGVFKAVIVLVIYYFSFNVLGHETAYARTTALVTLILLEIGGAFIFRSFRYKVLTRSVFVNMYLFGASVISVVATLAIIYTPLRAVFGTVPLGLGNWGMAILVTLGFVAVYDGLKEIGGRKGWLKLFID
jgi:Ca2+-transporting ATPase